MTSKLKILKTYITNFIEYLPYVSAILTFGIFLENAFDFHIDIAKLFNVESSFLSEIDSYIWYILLPIFVLIIAFKKKYVRFSKSDWYQNILSVIFLLLTAVLFCAIFCVVYLISIMYGPSMK